MQFGDQLISAERSHFEVGADEFKFSKAHLLERIDPVGPHRHVAAQIAQELFLHCVDAEGVVDDQIPLAPRGVRRWLASGVPIAERGIAQRVGNVQQDVHLSFAVQRGAARQCGEQSEVVPAV